MSNDFSEVNYLFNNINNSINKLKQQQSDIKSDKIILRDSQESANIDYTFQYQGNGVHNINAQKAKEINMEVQQIMNKGIILKINDALNEFIGEIK